MICIWVKDSHRMYEFAPGCKSRESGLCGGLGEREVASLGWRKVLHSVKNATLCYRTGLRVKPLIFALLEGLHRCEAIRCWQAHCVLSGQLSLCESALWLSKISLGSLTRRGYQLPCSAWWGSLFNLYKRFVGMCIFRHHGPDHSCN